MTISTIAAKSRYAGDGSTTSFPTGFRFFDNEHVRVILRRADGSEVVWSEGSEYSLSGAGQPGGGTVQVSTSPVDRTPTAGETLVVKLAVPPRQETSLPLGGAFPSTAVEGMADLAALRDQQIEEALSRVVKFKESTALADVELPEPGAGKPIGWNAAGDAIVNLKAIGRWQGDWAMATAYVALDVVRAPVTKHIYVCEVAHTSDDFTTDLDAGKWSLAIDFDGAVADAEAAQAAAEAAQAGAETAEGGAQAAQSGAETAQAGAETAEAGAETAEANAAASAAAALAAQQTLAGVNNQTGTAYTLQSSDAGKIVEMNNAGANTVTIDTQANATYPANAVIEVVQIGAGQTTIAVAGGVTLRSADSAVDLRVRYSGATLYRRGDDDWVLVGDIA